MIVKKHRQARRDKLIGPIDLGFASNRWRNFIVKQRSGKRTYDRRALEVRLSFNWLTLYRQAISMLSGPKLR